jgi:hypothetical protein
LGLTKTLVNFEIGIHLKTDQIMGKVFHSLLIISMALAGPLCHSQTTLQISEPRLELKNQKIHIYYDIDQIDSLEKVFITIDIRDEKGNPIEANALDGDIGTVENGGMNKQIVWNLEADSVFINTYIFVKINARVIPPPVQAIVESEEETTQKIEDSPEEKEPASESKSSAFNRTAIMLQSLALPGLGLSRVTGNPHWIRGVAGYGCLAGSVILNRQAIRTFDSVEDLDDPDKAEVAFDNSVRQDKISTGLAYAALGIWIADVVWTWVGTSDLNKLSVGTVIDPLSHAPMLCFRYTFQTMK